MITDRDVCYIEVEDCEVFFSSEMYGIQVVFTTANISEEVADAIVASITEHLAEVTGEDLYMVRA